MCLTEDDNGPTSDKRRRTLYNYTCDDIAAVTTHAQRTITSHTVRWTINVTTGSSRSKTYGRKRSFVRIRMIVRVRARTGMCVSELLCMCACGGKWQRFAVKRSGSFGFRRMTPTEYERYRAPLPVDESLFGVRARPNSNEPRCGLNVPKSETLQALEQPCRWRLRAGPEPCGRRPWRVPVGLRFTIRIARFSPGKIP